MRLICSTYRNNGGSPAGNGFEQLVLGVGMIVCVCNAINCKTVRRSVDDGARSIAGVFKSCGKTPQCGRCFTTIRGMVGDAAPATQHTGCTAAIAAE